MRSILSIAVKDLRLLGRDKFALFWIVMFPILYATLFGSIMGGMGGVRGSMPIAVFDEDQSDTSKAFVERVGKSKGIRLREFPTPAAARDAVRRGNLVAVVIVQKGFGQTNLFAGQSLPLDVGIDPKRTAEAGMLQGILMEANFKGMMEQFTNPARAKDFVATSLKDLDRATDMSPVQKALLKNFLGSFENFVAGMPAQTRPTTTANTNADTGSAMQLTVSPINPDSVPRSAYDISFPSAILWGVMGCCAGFAVSLVKERTAGTLMRLRLAPITRTHVLGGKALACFLATCTTILLVLLVGALFFRIRFTSPLKLTAAVLAVAVCFVGIMMLMSTIGKTEEAVGGAGWAFNTIMAMIGGAMIPLIAMPPWMLKISTISPVAWSIEALEGAIWRDYSMLEMLRPAGVLLAIGVICVVAGSRLFAKTEA